MLSMHPALLVTVNVFGWLLLGLFETLQSTHTKKIKLESILHGNAEVKERM